MFSLIAWRQAARGRFGFAALAAGAAINVKLAAGPAALLLLACVRSREQFLKAFFALLLASLPFVVTTIIVGRPFLEMTLLYRPPGGLWLPRLPMEWSTSPFFGPIAAWFASAHAATLIQFTLLWIITLAAAWHRRGRAAGIDLLTLGALFWAALLLWMGGPYQYAIWPLPLLAATRPRIALLYGSAAAVWLAWAYTDALVARWPFQSLFFVTTPRRSEVAVALPLAALLMAVISLAKPRAMVEEPARP